MEGGPRGTYLPHRLEKIKSTTENISLALETTKTRLLKRNWGAKRKKPVCVSLTILALGASPAGY